VATWQHHKRVLGIFSPRMRRSGYLGTSGQNSDTAIRSGHLDFLYRCISTTKWRLRDIFDVLCYCVAWPWDLDLWPFDLESVLCTVLLMSDPHTNLYYPITIGYRVTSTEYLITFPLSETVTAHAPCHVTSNRGKNSPHFWNPWPQFTYSLCHYQGAMTRV